MDTIFGEAIDKIRERILTQETIVALVAMVAEETDGWTGMETEW